MTDNTFLKGRTTVASDALIILPSLIKTREKMILLNVPT